MKKALLSSLRYLIIICIYIGCANSSQIVQADKFKGLWEPSPVKRIKKHFKQAQIDFPPQKITLIAIKDKKIVELWALNMKKEWKLIHNYPILAASGKLGPKLREGDLQVPEGLYKISWLNPNSKFHLSMKLNFPNEYDWQKAKKENRKEPGSDIFFHGSNVSIGCLAMGNTAIEELYTVVEKIGAKHTNVIISPVDMRRQKPDTSKLTHIPWIQELYAMIEEKINFYK